jgi:hypothetical protein
MMDQDIESMAKQVDPVIDWLAGVAQQERDRAKRAADAGGELAQEVYRFVMAVRPTLVDLAELNTLDAAYEKFMAQHSANFSNTSNG